jgi:hypothetical protein
MASTKNWKGLLANKCIDQNNTAVLSKSARTNDVAEVKKKRTIPAPISSLLIITTQKHNDTEKG